jgi:hypothetical protein
MQTMQSIYFKAFPALISSLFRKPLASSLPIRDLFLALYHLVDRAFGHRALLVFINCARPSGSISRSYIKNHQTQPFLRWSFYPVRLAPSSFFILLQSQTSMHINSSHTNLLSMPRSKKSQLLEEPSQRELRSSAQAPNMAGSQPSGNPHLQKQARSQSSAACMGRRHSLRLLYALKQEL